MAKTSVKKIKITLLRSLNRRTEKVQATVRGLGLRRRHHCVVVDLTPENKGMIDKISYLISTEEV